MNCLVPTATYLGFSGRNIIDPTIAFFRLKVVLVDSVVSPTRTRSAETAFPFVVMSYGHTIVGWNASCDD